MILGAKHKTAIIDASSAIILAKVGLHTLLSEQFQVVMSKTVFDEVCGYSLPGAAQYRSLLKDGEIAVMEPGQGEDEEIVLQGASSLHQGERDSLCLYFQRAGDFIIIDDGKAAKWCKANEVPFINSLLLPIVLRTSGLLSKASCLTYCKEIVATGRYASWVIDFADKCLKDETIICVP